MGLCPSRSRTGGAAEPLMAGAADVGSCPSAASTSSGKGKVKSLKLCGPSKIQVLRGQLRGRKVAMICCSEAHEDAIDITRKDGIVDKYEDWIQLVGTDASGFNIANAWKSKVGVTLEKAKQWAEETLDEAEESEEDDSDSEAESEEEDDLTPENKVEKDGAILVFIADGGKKKGKGSAYIFLRGTERHPRYALPPSCVAFEWGDLDEDPDMPVDELDALLERRKAQRRAEGLEIFDDWLVRHIERLDSLIRFRDEGWNRTSGAFRSCDIPIEVVLEAPIPADEVELHVEEGVPSAPLAHPSLRRLELDSDSDSEDENDGGSDAYIDYLRRRLQSILPRERLHCMDPRELGEGSEGLDLRESFRRLRIDPLTKDAEEEELCKAAPKAKQDEDETRPPALPSFESFFGAAADLLYYHPEVKADYAPFLVRCVKSPEKLRSFFDRLFFGTEACEELQLDEQTRPLARIRSLAYEESPGGTLQRRPRERPAIAVKALPVDCYLKACGSSPARTWVSGLAERVSRAGGEAFASAAQAAYGMQVEQLLADPKNADEDGDYFEDMRAWLREVFPDIYADVDSSDPAELRKLDRDFAPSEKRPNSKKHRHKLKDITIPNFADAFAELKRFDPDERISTRRERVLAKILIDAFLLCIVDVAAVLRTAEAILKAPEESQLILVLYAGGTHIQHQVKFWQAQGFSSKALPNKGVLGQDDYEEFEPRGLDVPACLRDLSQLFPVELLAFLERLSCLISSNASDLLSTYAGCFDEEFNSVQAMMEHYRCSWKQALEMSGHAELAKVRREAQDAVQLPGVPSFAASGSGNWSPCSGTPGSAEVPVASATGGSVPASPASRLWRLAEAGTGGPPAFHREETAETAEAGDGDVSPSAGSAGHLSRSTSAEPRNVPPLPLSLVEAPVAKPSEASAARLPSVCSDASSGRPSPCSPTRSVLSRFRSVDSPTGRDSQNALCDVDRAFWSPQPDTPSLSSLPSTPRLQTRHIGFQQLQQPRLLLRSGAAAHPSSSTALPGARGLPRPSVVYGLTDSYAPQVVSRLLASSAPAELSGCQVLSVPAPVPAENELMRACEQSLAEAERSNDWRKQELAVTLRHLRSQLLDINASTAGAAGDSGDQGEVNGMYTNSPSAHRLYAARASATPAPRSRAPDSWQQGLCVAAMGVGYWTARDSKRPRPGSAKTATKAKGGWPGSFVVAGDAPELLRKVQWPAEWPYTEADFARQDESSDNGFYSQPRICTHVDDALLNWDGESLEGASTFFNLVDICSSWISHYPTEKTWSHVSITGMNEYELAQNKQADDYTVRDLNDNPKLPYDDSSFDIVTCTVSFDYLNKPLEVMKEVGRVLKPGGMVILSTSNRCFPTKAVNIWLQTGDLEHVLIYGSYMHYAGSFEEPEALDLSSPLCRLGFQDPVYAATRVRRATSPSGAAAVAAVTAVTPATASARLMRTAPQTPRSGNRGTQVAPLVRTLSPPPSSPATPMVHMRPYIQAASPTSPPTPRVTSPAPQVATAGTAVTPAFYTAEAVALMEDRRPTAGTRSAALSVQRIRGEDLPLTSVPPPAWVAPLATAPTVLAVPPTLAARPAQTAEAFSMMQESATTPCRAVVRTACSFEHLEIVHLSEHLNGGNAAESLTTFHLQSQTSQQLAMPALPALGLLATGGPMAFAHGKCGTVSSSDESGSGMEDASTSEISDSEVSDSSSSEMAVSATRTVMTRSATKLALMRHNLTNGRRVLGKTRCRVSGSLLLLGLICSACVIFEFSRQEILEEAKELTAAKYFDQAIFGVLLYLFQIGFVCLAPLADDITLTRLALMQLGLVAMLAEAWTRFADVSSGVGRAVGIWAFEAVFLVGPTLWQTNEKRRTGECSMYGFEMPTIGCEMSLVQVCLRMAALAFVVVANFLIGLLHDEILAVLVKCIAVGVLIQKIDPISMRLAGMIPSMAIARTRQLRSSIQGSVANFFSYRENRAAAAGIAGLVGNCSIHEVMTQAKKRFRCVDFSRLSQDELANNKPSPQVFQLSRGFKLGTCDAFVSHSWHDDAPAKWEALSWWKSKFEESRQRAPNIWFDKCCIDLLSDQNDIEADLRCLPIFLSGCSELVVFCRLWCIVELFTFVHIGGNLHEINIIPVLRRGQEHEDRQKLKASFLNFDVMDCDCFNQEDKETRADLDSRIHHHQLSQSTEEKMLDIIQTAFGDLAKFNDAVKAILDDIQWTSVFEEERQWKDPFSEVPADSPVSDVPAVCSWSRAAVHTPIPSRQIIPGAREGQDPSQVESRNLLQDLGPKRLLHLTCRRQSLRGSHRKLRTCHAHSSHPSREPSDEGDATSSSRACKTCFLAGLSRQVNLCKVVAQCAAVCFFPQPWEGRKQVMSDRAGNAVPILPRLSGDCFTRAPPFPVLPESGRVGSKESRSLPWIDNVACQACVTHSPTTFVVYPAGLSFVIMFSRMAQCTAAVVIKIALHGRLRCDIA
eukprot:s117_g22.t1